MTEYIEQKYMDDSMETINNDKVSYVINNVDEYYNSPDSIHFGKEYHWRSSIPVSFIYVLFNGINKLFYGSENGESHYYMNKHIVKDYIANKFGEYAAIRYLGGDRSSRYYENGIPGRVWPRLTIDGVEGREFSVFAFWMPTDNTIVQNIIRQVVNDLKLSDTEILIANGEGPFIPFNNIMDTKLKDNSAMRVIHLMNQQDKRDATADFRRNRDEMNGKRLGNMTQAQYNALRYVDESKFLNEEIDKETEELIRKTVRDMMKSGELPKDYDGEPVEMAEHFTTVMKNTFGNKYKFKGDEDDRISSSIIDDEFSENGGHYDLGNCENHLKQIKRDLKKVVVEEKNGSDKYILYADTMTSHNSDFMMDLEEQIEKKNVKRALEYLDESLVEEGEECTYNDIINNKKIGEIALEKEGYIFARYKDGDHEFFVYKKKDKKVNEGKNVFLTESQVAYIQKALSTARKETNTNPTEGQKEAGNYKMGRVKIFGFEIAIENPKGSYRRGKDRNGKEWKILMKNDYGYFTHTKAVDGDAVDVFLGSDFNENNSIFAIDQKINGKFDETKVMLGFKTEEEAKNAYLSNYEKDWKGFWRITEVSLEDFREWLYDGYKQRKPFSEYNEIKKKKLNENVDFHNREKLILGDDTEYVHVIDEAFDDIMSEYEEKNNITPFLTKESIEEIVSDGDLSNVIQSFDVQKQLNPKFWINGKLNSRVRLRLLDIADAFFDSMEVSWIRPKDIIMTGSLANYNWSKYSDIDLHIIVDFKEVDNRIDFVKDYFDSKKTIWNNTHEDLSIYGYPVELYVQDENEVHKASGIYSLERDEWIKEPERDNLASVKMDRETIVNKAKGITEKIDELEQECDGEKDVEKLDILSSRVKKLFDKIKGMRKDSLKSGNEMSPGNILFKILRRLGYIGKLVDLKRVTFDKINTIK